MEFNSETIITILVVALIIWMLLPKMEHFDKNTVVFVAPGETRFGLRGDQLRRSDIARLYIRPDRHIRLNATSGQMYEGNYRPAEEGKKGCKKMQCPAHVDEYDELDTCWQCGHKKPYCDCYYPLLKDIPDIHPH